MSKLIHQYTEKEISLYPKYHKLNMSILYLLDGICSLLLIPFNKATNFSANYLEYVVDYGFKRLK